MRPRDQSCDWVCSAHAGGGAATVPVAPHKSHSLVLLPRRGAARTYLEIKRRGIIQNFALAARYSSLVRGATLGGHNRVNSCSATILQHTSLSSRIGFN